MHFNKRYWVLGVVGFVLLSAWSMAAWGMLRVDAASSMGDLAKRLPYSIPGVKIEDVPLGSNEMVDFAAKKKLEFDDYVYRSYETASGGFTVYLAYWADGKRAASFVAAHTPDRCWTLAGMTCEGIKTDFVLNVDGNALPVGQWRRFRTPQGQGMNVVFWHAIGDGFYDYGGRFHSYTPPIQRVKDVIADTFVRAQEQYFIRIVSTQPIEAWQDDPVFKQVIATLPALNIRR